MKKLSDNPEWKRKVTVIITTFRDTVYHAEHFYVTLKEQDDAYVDDRGLTISVFPIPEELRGRYIAFVKFYTKEEVKAYISETLEKEFLGQPYVIHDYSEFNLDKWYYDHDGD